MPVTLSNPGESGMSCSHENEKRRTVPARRHSSEKYWHGSGQASVLPRHRPTVHAFDMTASVLSADAQAATAPEATLHAHFDAQRRAFGAGAPDYAKRMAALKELRDGLLAHREELVAAM